MSFIKGKTYRFHFGPKLDIPIEFEQRQVVLSALRVCVNRYVCNVKILIMLTAFSTVVTNRFFVKDSETNTDPAGKKISVNLKSFRVCVSKLTACQVFFFL